MDNLDVAFHSMGLDPRDPSATYVHAYLGM